MIDPEGRAAPADPPHEPAPVAASVDDVTNVYQLVMLREPDALAMAHDPGRPLADVFREKLDSEEFLDRVVPGVLALRPAAPYVPTRSFAEIRAWAAAQLPGSKELRRCIMDATSCEEILRQLLQDQSLIADVPRLRDAGIGRLARIQLGEKERFERARGILGEIAHADAFEIRGWCANRSNLAERLLIEVFADNIFLGALACDQYLALLQARLGGDGCHGFRFVIPGAFLPRLQHGRLVSVRERSTGVTIGSVRLRADAAPIHRTLRRIELEIDQLRENLAELAARLPTLDHPSGYPLELYNEYVQQYANSEPPQRPEIVGRMAACAARPTISFLVEADGTSTESLSTTIESIRRQAYENWELVLLPSPGRVAGAACNDLGRWVRAERRIRIVAPPDDAGRMNARLAAIRQSTGDWFGFVRSGDRLTGDAAFWLAAAALETDAGLIYSDEEVCRGTISGETEEVEPRFKGGFDEDLLLAHDYIGDLCFFRKDIFDQVKNFDSSYDDVFDYYLKLSIAARLPAIGIRHISRVLCRCTRTASEVPEESARLFAACAANYLLQTGRSATVEPHADVFGRDRPNANRIRWSGPASWPSLSILIPTRDRMDLLAPCLASASAAIAGYRGAAEILIVDNDSVETESKRLLDDWAGRPRVGVVPYHGEFSWSAINNHGAEYAKGDVLLFLNNDTLVLSDDWCGELVTQAWRREVGAVGARLLYQDGTLQHGGIILGAQNVLHDGAGERPEDGGYQGRTLLQRGVSAVTGACLATRREVFARAGGFDPQMRVEFSDIDYCLKVHSLGLRVIYTPFATMYHFESKSRGGEAAAPRLRRAAAERAIFLRRWRRLMGHDPFYNRHFNSRRQPFRWLDPPPADPLETVDWSSSEELLTALD